MKFTDEDGIDGPFNRAMDKAIEEDKEERRRAYAEKQEDKRERFEARADKAQAASSAAYQASSRIVNGIPMGQPILVGHHSEKRHRRDLARSDNAMRKSIDESDKAAHYRGRAASVGSGGVSSDDPDAVDKLRERVADLEQQRDLAKKVNKAYRQGKTEDLVKDGTISQGLLDSMLKTMKLCPWLKSPVDTKNDSANIRRLNQRIAELELREDLPKSDIGKVLKRELRAPYW